MERSSRGSDPLAASVGDLGAMLKDRCRRFRPFLVVTLAVNLLCIASLLYWIVVIVGPQDEYIAADWALLCGLWSLPLTLQCFWAYGKLAAKRSAQPGEYVLTSVLVSFRSLTARLLWRHLTLPVVGAFLAAPAVLGAACAFIAIVGNGLLGETAAAVWAAMVLLVCGVLIARLYISVEVFRPPEGGNESGAQVSRRAAFFCQGCCWWIVVLLFLALNFAAAIQASIGAADLFRFTHPGKLYTVYDHKMHLYCIGSGSPTVLFEHGWGGSYMDWSWVQPAVALHTRTCSYDHSGTGFSEIGPYPRSSQQIAREWAALIGAANISDTEPLLLVGHSFAGFNMRAFRSLNVGRVRGMVMVDAVNPSLFSPIGFGLEYPAPPLFRLGANILGLGLVRIVMPSLFGPLINELPPPVPGAYYWNVLQLKYYLTRIAEWQSWPVSAATAQSTGSLGDLPLVVMWATKGIGYAHAEENAKLSTNSTIIEVESSHEIPFHKGPAALVTEQTLKMLATLRAAPRPPVRRSGAMFDGGDSLKRNRG